MKVDFKIDTGNWRRPDGKNLWTSGPSAPDPDCTSQNSFVFNQEESTHFPQDVHVKSL